MNSSKSYERHTPEFLISATKMYEGSVDEYSYYVHVQRWVEEGYVESFELASEEEMDAKFNEMVSKYDTEDLEYKVVYDNNGYQIDAASCGWIPDKGLARKVMKKKQGREVLRDKLLYLIARPIEGKRPRTCRTLNGKAVLNREHLYFDALEIGDLVEQDAVTELVYSMPAASTRSNCAQLGEPAGIRIDETGRERNTYLTFSRVDSSTFRYCGDCFQGENVQRGKEPPYCRAAG